MTTKKFKIKLTFYSNMNSQLFNVNVKALKTKKNNLKNFMYFLCLYNYIFNSADNKLKLEKPKLFIAPKFQKKFTLLRAPFRHKLTKKNYSLTRYKLSLFLHLFIIDLIKLKDTVFLKNYTVILIQNLYWFETNVQHLHRIDLFMPVLFKKFKL